MVNFKGTTNYYGYRDEGKIEVLQLNTTLKYLCNLILVDIPDKIGTRTLEQLVTKHKLLDKACDEY